MITSAEFENIPLFAAAEEQEQRRLARRAADIHLEPGEWLIREGEEPRFFVVLAGEQLALSYAPIDDTYR
jgi:thioredoxin reductase (NADPH)